MDEFWSFNWLTPDRVAMLMFIFNAAVQALPDPNGSKGYTWFYRMMHLLAANIRVTAKKFPSGKQENETQAVNAMLVTRLKELGQQDWLDTTFQEEMQ